MDEIGTKTVTGIATANPLTNDLATVIGSEPMQRKDLAMGEAIAPSRLDATANGWKKKTSSSNAKMQRRPSRKRWNKIDLAAVTVGQV